MAVKLCIGTKKGAFILTSDEDRDNWNLSEPILFGNIIYHFVPDPRNYKTMLIAASTGHLGPTVFRSQDKGTTWIEASKPPRFESEDSKSVKFAFWLTPGHSSEPETWYAGTSPQGLFKSSDGGNNWAEVLDFANHPLISEITKNNEGSID